MQEVSRQYLHEFTCTKQPMNIGTKVIFEAVNLNYLVSKGSLRMETVYGQYVLLIFLVFIERLFNC